MGPSFGGGVVKNVHGSEIDRLSLASRARRESGIMLTVFTFPGQGAQRPGMLGRLPQDAGTRARICEAETILGQPVRSLDTAEALQDTRNVQLALVVSGVTWAEYLMRQGVPPDYVLGLSIGAYAAAIIAGSLQFHDAIRLVDLRGRLMQQAYPSGYGMMALTGPQQSEVEKAVHDQRSKGALVFLANLNSEHQFVLSGERSALIETARSIRSRIPCSEKMLDVAVPSHCELLEPQADKLASAFNDIALGAPRSKYVSASSARVLFQPEDIRRDLARNMCLPMRWHESSVMLVERGVEQAIEMPPGTTLTALFRRVLPSGVCKSVN